MKRSTVVTLLLVLLKVSSAVGNIYYVDSKRGSDANNGLTVDSPFRTINKGVHQTVAGDVVLVRAGTYFEEIVLDHGGSAGSPILVRNYANEKVIVDGSMDVTGTWANVTGTIWRAPFTRGAGVHGASAIVNPACVSTTPDNWYDSGYLHAFCYVDSTADATHWLLPVNIMSANPPYTRTTIPSRSFATTSPPPPQAQGFYENRTDTIYANLSDGSNPNSHRIRIPARDAFVLLMGLNSYIVLRGLNFQLATGGVNLWTPQKHLTIDSCSFSLTANSVIVGQSGDIGWAITNNHFSYGGDESIHVQGDSCLLSNNLVENSLMVDRVSVDGINILGWYNSITRNEFRNLNGVGVFVELYVGLGNHPETGQYNSIDRNLIHDCGGGITISGCDSNVVSNNIIYNMIGAGITIATGWPSWSDAQRTCVYNRLYFNTIYNVGDAGVNLYPTSGSVVSSLNTVIRNNIIYKAGTSILDRGVGTVADHNVTTNPLFVNPTAGDFHLQGNSPAINSGIDVGLTTDFASTRRPQGGKVDVGALEYVSGPATGGEEGTRSPKDFNLRQNYPNPFNPSTTIQYDLPRASFVTIKLFNVLGQQVGTLVNGMEEAGYHQVRLSTVGSDSISLTSGVYLYRMQAGDFVDTRKLLILK